MLLGSHNLCLIFSICETDTKLPGSQEIAEVEKVLAVLPYLTGGDSEVPFDSKCQLAQPFKVANLSPPVTLSYELHK